MPEAPSPARTLPLPFYDRPWPAALRPAARALWQWHLALWDAALWDAALWDGAVPPGADRSAFLEAEAARVAAGETGSAVPGDVWRAALEACRAQDLPRELLAEQLRAAAVLGGPVRFATQAELAAFADAFAGSHARLLARLAGVAGSWQLPQAGDLGAAFFLVGRLAVLPADLARDRLFIPEADLEQAGVSLEQLRQGRVDEGVRRLLWKQGVRAQQLLARGEPLAADLPRRYRGALKRAWFGSIEVLAAIRRRGYDVWSAPVALTPLRRLQVHYQARFGRTTFRG